jgi:pectin methylesterase-like acyl-CoA thioesterase
MMRRNFAVVYGLFFAGFAGGSTVAVGQGKEAITTLKVAADGSGQYTTVQAAVDHLPESGGVVAIAPGTYREQVIVNGAHVTFKGMGISAEKTVIVDDTSQGTRGTKPSYATVHVLGDDFHAENVTFENDFNRTHEQGSSGSQAQALNMEGDRNVLTNVRILGNQDTLYVGAKGCGQSGSRRAPAGAPGTPPAPCVPQPTRSYFSGCVIYGNVDYIYGDGTAVFDGCEIHNTEHAAGGYVTAQGKYLADQQSVYVFNHCRLTGVPGLEHVFLGRPWRPYAAVVYLNTEMGAHIDPAGWREWHPGETHNLDTVFYAEYNSTGPGAGVATREPKSHQLTATEAAKFAPSVVLAGSDHWNPVKPGK